MPEPARPRASRTPVARWLVPCALAVPMVVPWSPANAGDPCETATLTIEGAPPGVVALRRGQEVTVTGRGFVDGCGSPDAGPLLGCHRREPVGEPTSMRGVELEVVGGRVTRREITLGVADAGAGPQQRLGEISWTVVVPDGQVQGPARLQAEASSGFAVGVGVQVIPAE